MAKSNQIPPSHRLAQEDARCQKSQHMAKCILMFLCCASCNMFRSTASDHSNDYTICTCQAEVQFFFSWFEQKCVCSSWETVAGNSQNKIWKQPVHLNKKPWCSVATNERTRQGLMSEMSVWAGIKDGAVWGLTPLCLNSWAEKEGRLWKLKGHRGRTPSFLSPLHRPFMMGSSVLWQVCEVGTLLEVIAISLLWVIVCPYAWKDR